MNIATLHHLLVDRPFNSLDEACELLVLIRGNARGNYGPGYAAGPAKRSLGSNENVRDVLQVSTLGVFPA